VVCRRRRVLGSIEELTVELARLLEVRLSLPSLIWLSFGTYPPASSASSEYVLCDPNETSDWAESRLGAFFNVFRLDLILLPLPLSLSSHDGEAECGETFSLEDVRDGRRRVREEAAACAPGPVSKLSLRYWGSSMPGLRYREAGWSRAGGVLRSV
jgi:hypothetical protein